MKVYLDFSDIIVPDVEIMKLQVKYKVSLLIRKKNCTTDFLLSLATNPQT
jgi:hypothetical protein